MTHTSYLEKKGGKKTNIKLHYTHNNQSFANKMVRPASGDESMKLEISFLTQKVNTFNRELQFSCRFELSEKQKLQVKLRLGKHPTFF